MRARGCELQSMVNDDEGHNDDDDDGDGDGRRRLRRPVCPPRLPLLSR